MSSAEYTYFATLEKPGGEPICDERLEVDFHPALECARFDDRTRRMGSAHPPSPVPVIRPVWSDANSPPYVRGFAVYASGREPVTTEFPLTYFSSAVSAASRRLVENGTLQAGQRFDYRVYALPNTSRRHDAEPSCDVVADDAFPEFDTQNVTALLARAERIALPGVPDESASLAPAILIPRRVLTEATELARQADDVETGGVLVGRLCRAANGRICYRITAQIAAEHTVATRESLRFTPETWVSVNAAIQLRNLGETAMGWWHSHPWFCRLCPPERRAVCALSTPVFSPADRAVHREVFVRPWNVALLLSFLGEQEPSYDVFAWKQGQIEATEFYVLPDES